jgi:hypothetical protein
VNLRRLTIILCESFNYLPELPTLGYLHIESCSGLHILRLSGTNSNYPIYSVEIYNCSHLNGIIVTRSISRMVIRGCDELSHGMVKKQIGFLKIENCPKLGNISCTANIGQLEFGQEKDFEYLMYEYPDDEQDS